MGTPDTSDDRDAVLLSEQKRNAKMAVDMIEKFNREMCPPSVDSIRSAMKRRLLISVGSGLVFGDSWSEKVITASITFVTLTALKILNHKKLASTQDPIEINEFCNRIQYCANLAGKEVMQAALHERNVPVKPALQEKVPTLRDLS